jgi:DNA-binding NtrC family response regulator
VSSDASPEVVASSGDFDAPESQSYTHLKKKWIESFEVDYLSQLLNQHAGNVSAAAREARLDRSNFLRLLRKYGLKAEVFRSSAKMAA